MNERTNQPIYERKDKNYIPHNVNARCIIMNTTTYTRQMQKNDT